MLFRRTAVFAGSFGLDAVDEVCGGAGLESGEVVELLGRLVDKSLVAAEEERGEYRYRLLETIRQYARDRLGEAGETARLEARHRDWYLAVAEAADPDVAGERFFERAEVDLDNLRAALASGLRDDPRCALRMAVALWPLWMTRGYFTEGSRLLAAALAADEKATPLRARALVAAGALEVRLARPERVIGLAEEARTIHETLGDRRAVAAALLHRGVLEWTRSEYAGARHSFVDAFALAHELDEALVAAASLHAQGVEAHSRGQDEDARRLMGEGLSLLARAPRESGTTIWATTIGLVIDRDARGQPRMYFEDTLLMFRPVGPEAAAGYMLCNLALVARAQGDHDAAREALDRALALHRERDDPHGTAVALNGLGNLARSREQFELGREWLEEALAVRREVGDRRATAVTLGCLGLLAGRAGDVDGGRELIGQGLAICRETEDGTGRSGLLLNLGNLELEAGDIARARSILEEAADLCRSQILMRGHGWPLCAFVDALISPPAPNESRARELIDEARGIFRGTDDVRGLAQVDALEARLEQGRGAAKAGADAR